MHRSSQIIASFLGSGLPEAEPRRPVPDLDDLDPDDREDNEPLEDDGECE